MNKEKIKKVLSSKVFKIIVYVLGSLVVASIIFKVGMFVGFKKATFGRDWGMNYEMNFGRPEMGPKMRGGRFDEFGNLPISHGAIGKIIKISLPSIVVLDNKDNTEKVVLLDDSTEIRKVRESVKIGELKIDDNVVIIGIPNSFGQIEAKLLRIIPAPFMDVVNKIK